MNKKSLRQNFLLLRDKIANKSEKDQVITANFIELLAKFDNVKIIASYHPIKSEINLLELNQYLNKNFQLALPAIENNEMLFRQCGELVLNNGIMQPAASCVELMPDVIITPLLAVDLQGFRLGYGKGFYDKTIAKLYQLQHKPILVGLCYDCQITDKLPQDAHDQKINYIVSELRTINIT